ncbi:hypothetical protein IQ277_25030 [Nostocales cyanobacterium LEGE 12452]|nr:hypothetical protein [Nostocales cyanobacterium LEGE 12452]
MKFKLVTKFLMSAIALSGAAISPAMAQYQGQYQQPPVSGQYPQASASTSFICGRVGSDPATLVQANGRILPSPLIIWQTASNDMSPQQRCQMVSQRMTATVAQNGGKLSNLLLTTGNVNGFSVICFVNTAESCNPNNVIMTLLRGENARNPGNVLARIVRFGQKGKGSNVVESSGFTGSVGGEAEIIPTAVGLEEAVNQLANESGAIPAAPNPGNYTAPNPGNYTAPNPGNYTPVPDAGTGGGSI